jgi:hypothetical protein
VRCNPKINASITQGKEFCAQEIAAIEAAKMNGLPQKQRLEALLPAEQKVIRKRSRSVVQPIVLEYVSLLANFNCEGTGGFRDFPWNFGAKNVAIFCRARDHAE